MEENATKENLEGEIKFHEGYAAGYRDCIEDISTGANRRSEPSLISTLLVVVLCYFWLRFLVSTISE